MNVIALPLDNLPLSKSRDVLAIIRERQLDDWYWNENLHQYEPSHLDAKAYRVQNVQKGNNYIVHLWRNPVSNRDVAACECPATKLCKHIVCVARATL